MSDLVLLGHLSGLGILIPGLVILAYGNEPCSFWLVSSSVPGSSFSPGFSSLLCSSSWLGSSSVPGSSSWPGSSFWPGFSSLLCSSSWPGPSSVSWLDLPLLPPCLGQTQSSQLG